jgi:hypothetical protein
VSLHSSIDRRINADEWFRNLSEGAQLLWFRLMTGSHVTLVPGLWAATEDGLARAFKMPLERFRERFAELSREPSSSGLSRVLADWDAGVIWFPKSIEFPCNEPKNPNTLAAWKTHLELMPECDLKDQAFRHFEAWVNARKKRFPKGWPYGSRNRSRNGSGNPPPAVPSQEQEQEQEQESEKARALEPARTDVQRFADSFEKPGEVELYAFAAFAKAWNLTGAKYDAQRAACLRERVHGGMTKQDADDAIAGAMADDWIRGVKDGKPKRKLAHIFGTADTFEPFRDAGRVLREKPSGTVRKAETVAERMAADQAERDADRKARGLRVVRGDEKAPPPTREELDRMLGAIGGTP